MSFFMLITAGTTNEGTLITDILFAVCLVIMVGRFEPKPGVIASRVVEVVILYVIECSLDVLCYYVFDISGYPGPSCVSLFAVLILYMLLQTQLILTDSLARGFTFAALFMILVNITRTIMPAITGLQNVSWGSMVPSAISYVCMVACAIFIRVFSIEKALFLPKHYVILIVAMDLLGALTGYMFLDLHESYDFFDAAPTSGSLLVNVSKSVSWVSLIVSASFIGLILLAYFMFYLLAKEHDHRAEELVTKKSEIDTESMIRVTRETYQQLRELRHEIKNHDAYLSALLEEGDIDKVREYFDEHAATNSEAMHYVTCGNPIVDSVVNSKTALARSQGIELDAVLAVPSELPFDEEDVFRLLANLLDNAIEGTRASGLSSGPIKLKIMPEAGYYFVSVSNPCDPDLVHRDEDGHFLTTKTDSDVHGYGTRVIKGIAEKYQGTAKFEVRDRTFRADVMLARGAEEESIAVANGLN